MVQEQLGHSSLELTMRICGRWLPKKPIMGGLPVWTRRMVANLVAKSPVLALMAMFTAISRVRTCLYPRRLGPAIGLELAHRRRRYLPAEGAS